MSNALDRLKALNDKLDAKLSKKSNNKPTEPKLPEKDSTVENINSKYGFAELANNIIKLMSIDANTEPTRAANIHRVAELYNELNIKDKAPDFNNIFVYKAMNISGIGLKEDDFGEIREGKYCQIIAITYEPDKTGKKKAKNISLSYFGKAEKLENALKNRIMEFVLRWRYEKGFQNLEHYKDLLAKIKPANQLF